MDIQKIAKFLEESVEWLKESQSGCCRYILDDRLAVFVGWSNGYDEGDEECIHAKEDPSFAITTGIKVWTSDDIWCDFDYINFPYVENGDVLDMSLTVLPNQDYDCLASELFLQYDGMKDLVMTKSGKIVEGV